MKKQTHTPEPWRFDENKCPNLYLGTIEVDKGEVKFIASVYTTMHAKNGNDTARANAKRIVACVNAMQGIEDPASFMEIVKQLELDAYQELKEGNEILTQLYQACQDRLHGREDEYMALLKQRNALLQACKAVIGSEYGCAPSVGYMDELKQKCEAAIKLVEARSDHSGKIDKQED